MTAASVRTMREICFLMLSISYQLLCGLWLRKVRIGDDRCRHSVGTAVPLQQSLMRRSKEREPRQKVFVIRFDAPGQSGARVTGDDQRDQDRVYIYLITIR